MRSRRNRGRSGRRRSRRSGRRRKGKNIMAMFTDSFYHVCTYTFFINFFVCSLSF